MRLDKKDGARLLVSVSLAPAGWTEISRDNSNKPSAASKKSVTARAEPSMSSAAATSRLSPNRGFTLIYAGLGDFLRNPQEKFSKGVIGPVQSPFEAVRTSRGPA